MPSYITKDDARRELTGLYDKATIEAFLAGFSGGQVFRPGTLLRQMETYRASLEPKGKSELRYYCDAQRHLVCLPYTKDNLHRMAVDLGISRNWFDRDHYDIPLRRVEEIRKKCIKVRPQFIVKIIQSGLLEQPKQTYENKNTDTADVRTQPAS